MSTASHGGIFVPDELLLCFTQSEKDYAEKWSGSKNWYEEDCAAAIPMFRLPELFPMDEGKRKEYYNNAKIYWEK